MEENWKWIILTIISALLLPIVIYYSFGRRYDRVRPTIEPITPSAEIEEEVDLEQEEESSDEDPTYSGDFLPAFLSSIKIFGFLDRRVFDLLAAHLQERNCKAGETILEMDREGRVDRSFYVVVEGKVELNIPPGQRDIISAALFDLARSSQVLHTVGPGGTVSSLFSILSIFAEHPTLPLADQSTSQTADTIRPVFPRLHSSDNMNEMSSDQGALIAKAVTDTKLLMIPEQAFHQLASEFPSAAAHITIVVLTRFQRVTFLSLYRYLGLARELAAMESDINSKEKSAEEEHIPKPIASKKDYLNGLSCEEKDSLLINTFGSILKLLQFADWDETELREFALKYIELSYFEPGEFLVQHGSRNPGLFFVLSGLIEGRIDTPPTVIYCTQRGLCGTLAAFLGHNSFIDIKSSEESIVAVLTRRGVHLLVQRDPNVMFRLARRLLNRLSPLVRSVDLLLDWRHLNAGKVLVHPGDPIEGIFIVLNGRLRNVTKKFEYGQGDVIGSSALLIGSEHRSTVIAMRDSELACMPKSLFDLLTRSFPSLALSMSRNLAARQTGQAKENISIAVAILPISKNMPLEAFVERLQEEITGYDSCSLIDSSHVMEALGKDAFAPIGRLKLSGWLSEQEELYKVTLMLADENPMSPWTKRCIRQADCILIVALAEDEGKNVGGIEKLMLKSQRTRQHIARRELVLLHGQRLCPPGVAMGWLKARPWIYMHHHIYMQEVGEGHLADTTQNNNGIKGFLPPTVRRRLDRPIPRASTAPSDDFGRLARHLLNRSVGVVLSGGGARGLAHVGAIRALCELNIPIDIVGGTSIGAFVGGLYASDSDWLTLPTRIRYFCERAGSRWRQLGDLTWPYCAWFTGHSLNRALWKLFGGWMVDDLWLPYFCVTTDISTSRKAVHRANRQCDDYTWRYVRASMSLSGLVPPMCDRLGHMHVDGGYLSTVPVEVLQEEFGLSLGKIIVVDVSAAYHDPGRFKIGDAVSGFLPAFKRLCGLESNIPSLEEIQTRIAFVSSDAASKALLESPGILVIKPSVGHISILDFLRYQEVMKIGYEETVKRVEEWRASGQFPMKPQKSSLRRRSL